jgi:nucleotide-binding universal stress UspA family protein
MEQAMELHSIVVGLELGNLSDHAVTRAIELARAFGARLDVVHGVDAEPPTLGASRKAFYAEHAARAEVRGRDAARVKLGALVAGSAWADRPVDELLHVSAKSGAKALLDQARHADLVVLGAHRHRKLLDFGGTGRAVLARSPCPVWVQPGETRAFPRVLAAVDLSPSSALVLEAARSMAQRFGASVSVLHVFTPPSFAYDPEASSGVGPTYVIDGLRDDERTALRELVAGFDWRGVSARDVFVEAGEPAQEIVERAGGRDLVVMGTHGHTALARAVLGSCAYRVLKHGEGPMLVVPQREEHQRELASAR